MTITTIVILCGHRESFAQALESAIVQTGDFEHEILVLDDASTDGTTDIVRGYAKRYPGLVKDISNRENLGISGNLKHAFSLAGGEYIAILEGDDYWTDTRKLEKQLAFLEENRECPMVFSRIRLQCGETYNTLPRQDNLPEKLGNADLLAYKGKNPICSVSCCLFRKDALEALPDIVCGPRFNEMAAAFFLVQLGPIGHMQDFLSVHREQNPGCVPSKTKEVGGRRHWMRSSPPEWWRGRTVGVLLTTTLRMPSGDCLAPADKASLA